MSVSMMTQLSIIRSTSTDYISISHCHSPYDVFMGRQLGLGGGREGGREKGMVGEGDEASTYHMQRANY